MCELLRHWLRLVKNWIAVRNRNRVHVSLDKHSIQVPNKTKFSKKAVAWMRELSLGFVDDAILRSDLALLAALDEQTGYVRKRSRPSRWTTPGFGCARDGGGLLRRDARPSRYRYDIQVQQRQEVLLSDGGRPRTPPPKGAQKSI